MRTVHADDITDLAGASLGPTAPLPITQDRVSGFADATDDHQWIHVDPERAAGSPFGGTIAHGFLTLSLVPRLLKEMIAFEGFSTAVNYGCDRVRFISPVPVGSAVTATAVVEEVAEVSGGYQLRIVVTIAVVDAPKPACVAEILLRQLR